MDSERVAEIERKTGETDIRLAINIDGSGTVQSRTGVPFMDHMLELFGRHGLFDLDVQAQGDVDVDYHHTVEDVGIVLGQAVKQAIGDKLGIERYGFFLLPMDETLVQVSLDLSNRSYLVYNVLVSNYMIRDFNICLVKEFFQAFANECGCNLHIQLEYGSEPHHVCEAIFKGFARALDRATRVDPRQDGQLPSTKGLLT
ncbi:MAG: imidazoleglycerol-phosphate dehydratase HisB [Opitutae bacterium]|jgi:imidazoleglycerol-phosphate dehydratase|nr:imidazoleglycerol-phosphate dehydratase HisB [Opitutae bacterium]MBT5691370.1 imidazoleglycerol-phosphate dehydratase HisB [Opitutae bacterium]MBT6463647.1 imidazoleglycerol-phosphate dehydratase HisB [Opitutae bacterium]MBT6959000.1 imidazoleglycerol-phosphate dehydratase HisB [Opitutae bacterium]MBT7855266.1 imidazoleglycerol-phosphate dehydratase HisB [Opitutae bacterium]